MSIPKIIHYCWFGGRPLPGSAKRRMDSWQRFCPDYTFVRWDENNAPLEDNEYVRQAYAAEKWAFVSDYVRLAALCGSGGIYLDTDVELRAPLDGFLTHDAFMGFERADRLATCLIGARAGHTAIERLAGEYAHISFLGPDGAPDYTTNVQRITAYLQGRGLRPDGSRQDADGISIYPTDFFSPKDIDTGKIHISENTCAIHHFDASWMPASNRFNMRTAQLLGPKLTAEIKRIMGRS